MTFLLFLVSLGLLHYIVKQVEDSVVPGEPETAPPAQAAAPVPAAAPVVPAIEPVIMPGLLALGKALDEYGRGRAPQPAEAPVAQEVRKAVEAPRK